MGSHNPVFLLRWVPLGHFGVFALGASFFFAVEDLVLRWRLIGMQVQDDSCNSIFGGQDGFTFVG